MPGPIQSIERAAAILRLLGRSSGGLGVSEIAGSLGLVRGTVHGILRTLVRLGFAEQDESTGKYRLGQGLLHLDAGHLDANELRSHAINWADTLAARSGEAVRVGTFRNGRVLVVHHVFRPDDTPQTLDVGALLPPHATALGKVLLAYDATLMAGVEQAGMERFSRRTIVTPKALRHALKDVRGAGWAGEVAELTADQASVAAPIRGHGGLVVGAIGLSGPLDRVCDASAHPSPSLVRYVRAAAHAVSRDIAAARW